MVKMIHSLTGSEMWVADNRVEEYKAAGHKLAAEPETQKPTKKPEAKKAVKK